MEKFWNQAMIEWETLKGRNNSPLLFIVAAPSAPPPTNTLKRGDKQIQVRMMFEFNNRN